MLLCILPAEAYAASADRVVLDAPCLLSGKDKSDPSVLIRTRSRFDCAAPVPSDSTLSLWVRHDLGHLDLNARQGWTYDHGLTQARDERVWIQLADGRIFQSPTTREGARRILGGPTQRFAIPRADGKIVTLLVRVDGLHNRRGPGPRAVLTNAAAATSQQAENNLIFGVLAGILAAILFYNVTLWSVLRHRALSAFCWPIAGAFFYGLVWSNLILVIAPGMTTATQFGWNAFSIAFCFWGTAAYFDAFVEPDKIKPVVSRAIRWLGWTLLAMTAFRILPLSHAVSWRMQDVVAYGVMFLMLALLTVNTVTALRRKSRAIRFFLLGWSPVLMIALARLLWGVGSIRTESALFDASPFIALSVQALLSSVALAWKFRAMQTERDEAVSLAETDPLSGLLNRRALLAEAHALGGEVHLVLLDVDHFKAINDRHGHDAGDKVITSVARILKNFSPDGALVGRLGGDEFAIVLPAGADPTLAERLRRVVARAEILPDREQVTICAGQALGPAATEADWKRLYIAADKALYAAKRNGRDQVHKAQAA